MLEPMLCKKGCRQRAEILKQLVMKPMRTSELVEVLMRKPGAKYAYIYKHLEILKRAKLIYKKGGKWRITTDKKRKIYEALDPCILKLYLKLYVAGASTALKVLRTLPVRVPFLLSAGLYWDGAKFNLKDKLDFASETFVDSGAQQFYKKFNTFSYPYSPREYVDFALRVKADLLATLDLPLDILTPRGLSVQEGIKRTTEYGVDVFAYAEKLGIKTKIVPVVQGYNDPTQWLESIDQYLAHGIDAKVWGIGSLCMTKSRRLVDSVLKAVRHSLKSRCIHVFGLALDSLREVYRYIDSFDTSAWIYWAKKDGAVLLWDSLKHRFIHLQARDGKRYDTLSLMRANIESLMSMVRDLSNLKHLTLL